MKGKITLITSPDFFENHCHSIFFAHLSEDDQQRVSEWLAKSEIDQDLNIYFYSGETDLAWPFYAISICQYKYIDTDYLNTITQNLIGYILGKPNTLYKTSNENLAQIYRYINQNRITEIESFLERAIND